MQDLDPTKPLCHAMHIDVSVSREQAENRVAAALAAGGCVIDNSGAPASWILADRAGDRVCVAACPTAHPNRLRTPLNRRLDAATNTRLPSRRTRHRPRRPASGGNHPVAMPPTVL
jgi:hypothetical protein